MVRLNWFPHVTVPARLSNANLNMVLVGRTPALIFGSREVARGMTSLKSRTTSLKSGTTSHISGVLFLHGPVNQILLSFHRQRQVLQAVRIW